MVWPLFAGPARFETETKKPRVAMKKAKNVRRKNASDTSPSVS